VCGQFRYLPKGVQVNLWSEYQVPHADDGSNRLSPCLLGHQMARSPQEHLRRQVPALLPTQRAGYFYEWDGNSLAPEGTSR
jgi:hypothetical protein